MRVGLVVGEGTQIVGTPGGGLGLVAGEGYRIVVTPGGGLGLAGQRRPPRPPSSLSPAHPF